MTRYSEERDDYRTINRRGWAWLSGHQCEGSVPIGLGGLEHAHDRLDRYGFLPWHAFQSVLCLACGGGQQGPLFASLGYRVTVADLTPEQLEKDIEVARTLGIEIECLEADMLDLSMLHGRNFDLVYQSISACYVPDVRRLYQEVSATLKPSGYYWVEHWSPFHAQLDPVRPWDGEAYRLLYPQEAAQPVPWYGRDPDHSGAAHCWHYIHGLNDLIGGLCDAGFTIERFAEASQADPWAEKGLPGHMARYLPPLLALMARRS